ncbi:MAG: isochorismate synthase [Thermochromatium sp.]
MLQSLHVLDQLKARLRDTLDLLPLAAGTGPVSLILELPHPVICAPDLAGPRFSFAHTHRGDLRAGYGLAGEWRAHGPERLRALRRIAQGLRDDWVQYDPDETGVTGLAMLGLAATPQMPTANDELPNALLWLPELALIARGGQSALVLTTQRPAEHAEVLARWDAWLERLVPRLGCPAPEPLTPVPVATLDSTPDRDDWQVLVRNALAEIDRDRLEKVVVCRRQRLQGQRSFDLDRLNAALGSLFPSCQVINIRRHAASFVAATPERLFTQHHDWVEADAIAGTAGRAEDSERDAAITHSLKTCHKNLREHRVVVEAVRTALVPYCRRLEPDEGPSILKLNNVQHLWTRLRGALHPGVDVFALAEHLHPTPATNGQPRRAARDWLRRHEPLERGWYTGVAGLIAPDLTGELWVLLRCAHILDRTADLYAGAGIVAGSDPASEWQETEYKLAAMTTALQLA